MASIKRSQRHAGFSVSNGHNDISQATKRKSGEAARQTWLSSQTACLKTNRTYDSMASRTRHKAVWRFFFAAVRQLQNATPRAKVRISPLSTITLATATPVICYCR